MKDRRNYWSHVLCIQERMRSSKEVEGLALDRSMGTWNTQSRIKRISLGTELIEAFSYYVLFFFLTVIEALLCVKNDNALATYENTACINLEDWYSCLFLWFLSLFFILLRNHSSSAFWMWCSWKKVSWIGQGLWGGEQGPVCGSCGYSVTCQRLLLPHT